MNKVILIGRLGDNPKVNTTDSGLKVANLSLATKESYKNKVGEKITNTEWHRLVCYGKGAEILEKYTSKGSLLCVEGGVYTRKWEDKDGNTRYSTEIKVSDFEFLGSSNHLETQVSPTGNVDSLGDDETGDLPF